MWVKCGLIGKAAEEAYRAKDVKNLESLRGRASSSSTGSSSGTALEIERMILQLRPKR